MTAWSRTACVPLMPDAIDLLVRWLLAIGASPKDIARAIGRDAA